MPTLVTTTHLMMADAEQLQARYVDLPTLRLEKVGIPNPHLNHFFFASVGIPFRWYSRLSWSYHAWEQYVEQDNVHTWIGYLQGTPFGYFELQARGDVTEIMFFGILSPFFGQGLGSHLLSCAINEAWKLPSTREVHVHTCDMDHPMALKNYLARGFSVAKTVTEMEDVPEADDPRWLCTPYYQSLRPQGDL